MMCQHSSGPNQAPGRARWLSNIILVRLSKVSLGYKISPFYQVKIGYASAIVVKDCFAYDVTLETDTKLILELTKMSIWFFLIGTFLQRILTSGWCQKTKKNLSANGLKFVTT